MKTDNREKRRAWERKYYKANKERLNRQHRESYQRHREERLAYAKEYIKRPGVLDRIRLQQRAYRAADPEKYRKIATEWSRKHIELRRLQNRQALAERDALHRADPQAYAEYRALHRLYSALSITRKKRMTKYSPRIGSRIPDWAVKGQIIIDYRSQYLADNITPAQRAYARDCAMEMKRAANGNKKGQTR